jgi:O-antigen/teichoic acid export membrane protein
MGSGPVLTQIIGIFTIPIITRLFDPDVFGEFSAIMSIVAPIGVLICLGYESSIVLANKKRDAIDLFVLCVLITLFITFLSLLIVSYYYYYFPESITKKVNSKFLLIIPVFLFFGGFTQSLRYLNVRDKNFGTISLANVTSTSFEKFFIIFFGFILNASSFILLIGSLVDSIIRPIIYSFKTINKELLVLVRETKLKDLKNLVIKYKKFPLYILPTNLFARLTKDIPVLMFLFFFTSYEVGLYAFGEVFYQKEANSKSKSLDFLKQLLKFNFWIGLFPFVVLAIFGDIIFTVFLGSEWTEAGTYSQVLSFLIFIRFITSFSSYLAITENKQEYLFWLNIISLAVTILGIAIGGYLENIYISLVIISFFNGLNYGIIGFWIIKLRGLEFKSVLKLFKKPFLIMLIIAIVLISFKLIFLKSSISFIALTIILFFIPYFIFFLKENKNFMNLKFKNQLLKRIIN